MTAGTADFRLFIGFLSSDVLAVLLSLVSVRVATPNMAF